MRSIWQNTWWEKRQHHKASLRIPFLADANMKTLTISIFVFFLVMTLVLPVSAMTELYGPQKMVRYPVLNIL